MRVGACVVIAVALASVPARGAETRLQTNTAIESVIRERLSDRERGDAAFHEAAELVDLIERTAAGLTKQEDRARFAFYRLRAMKNAIDAIDDEPSAAARQWIAAHDAEMAYNEFGARWMLNPAFVLSTHDTYRKTAAADDIAWLFVENGIAGECEGYVPCYVGWQNLLNGEYLRRYPRGRHADSSAVDVARSLNGVMDNLEASPAVLREFDPARHCRDLHENLDPLVAAIRASRSTRKSDALAAVDRFARLCRPQ